MVTVYILKCLNEKYYIGKTNNDVINRFKRHQKGNGAIWTKRNKPIEILEIYQNCDHFDEDKYTKIYMDKYGIDNVRGGSYTKIKLDNSTIEFLQKELLSIHNKCYGCGEKGHFIKNCLKYQNKIQYSNNNKLEVIESDNESDSSFESDFSFEPDNESDYYSESSYESTSE